MLFPLYDLNPHYRLPWVTVLLIVANLGVTVWTTSLDERRQSEINIRYGFVPARLSQVGRGKLIEAPLLTIDPQTGRPARIGAVELSTAPADVYATFVTTMFLHGGWLHVVMNMWMLWIFGNNIEDRLGHFVYIAYYLVGGVLATLCFWYSDANGLIPVVGASGAVATVLGGYAVTFPLAKVRTLLFFVFIMILDLPALVVLGFWFVGQLASVLAGWFQIALDPVAYWVHIGGFVTGMILTPLLAVGASPPGTDWQTESDALFRFDDPRE